MIAAELYEKIVQAEALELNYKPDIPDTETMTAILAEARRGDSIRKTSGRGPHRDDIDINIAGKSARVYGSQGQQKSVALVVKLAEMELMYRRRNEYPVVLLDEALAELDAERSAHLLASIPKEAQVIITTAQPDLLPPSLLQQSRHYHIERGSLEQK